MKGFTRMLVFVTLILADVANVTWAQGTQFPIIAWGCPNAIAQGLQYRDYFSQIDSAHFNTIYANFETQDYQAAPTLGLHLIQPIYWPYCEGQTSIYESDYNHHNPEHFSHTGVVGAEIYDPYDPINNTGALNNYAWLAQKTQHSAGYMQQGLLHDFNKEQNVLRENEPLYDPHVFFADFRLRTPSIANPPGGQTEMVRLYAVLNNSAGANQTLADWQVLYRDFVDSGAVGQSYANFRLRFCLTSDQDSLINPDNPAHGIDYRVYWYDNADVYLDRVTVQDTIYSALINHGYDTEMNARINTYNPYYPATLFRWYLGDEPQTDMYLANNYVNTFLESHTPATAQDVQATGGNIDRLEKFISVINPNQLAYDSCPFCSRNKAGAILWHHFAQRCGAIELRPVYRSKGRSYENKAN